MSTWRSTPSRTARPRSSWSRSAAIPSRSWCSKPSGAAPPSSARCTALDPRVVEIYDFGDLDGYFFVAMQYVEGRNLAEVLHAEQAIDANRAAVIALEICEQLRQVSLLAIHRGARRYQAVEYSHRGPTIPCGCSISASPKRCAPIAMPPRTISAAPAIARRSGWRGRRWISSRTCGRWARRFTKCWPARRRTRRRTRASWKR